MQESVIYQAILAQGEQRGRAQEARSLVTRLRNSKVGNLPIALLDRITNLSLEQVEALSDALLDFQELTDLRNWLDRS
jgi:predicted transposase YdaD